MRGSVREQVRRVRRRESGQMTIELAVVMPVAIIIALIVVNALTFFSECAAFDRLGRNAVRLCATSPAYGRSAADAVAEVQSMLEGEMPADNLDVAVALEEDALGHARFTMKLIFHPTLFGLGLRDEVLGVGLPALEHTKTIVVDAYKPGMLF